MPLDEKIDWSQCPLVEINPRVQSGVPVLRGTRMPVDTIIDNFDYGIAIAEISEQFEIPQDCIQAILSYAKPRSYDFIENANSKEVAIEAPLSWQTAPRFA